MRIKNTWHPVLKRPDKGCLTSVFHFTGGGEPNHSQNVALNIQAVMRDGSVLLIPKYNPAFQRHSFPPRRDSFNFRNLIKQRNSSLFFQNRVISQSSTGPLTVLNMGWGAMLSLTSNRSSQAGFRCFSLFTR